MSPDDAPIGTLCAVGHPANGVVARKGSGGEWTYLSTGATVDIDDVYRALSLLWMPGRNLP